MLVYYLYISVVRGHLIALGFLCAFILLALTQRTLLQRMNQRRDSLLKSDTTEPIAVEAEDVAEGEEDEEEDNDIKGDEAPTFRYRL